MNGLNDLLERDAEGDFEDFSLKEEAVTLGLYEEKSSGFEEYGEEYVEDYGEEEVIN